MTRNRETVRATTDGQRSDIIATMVGAIPSLNFDQAQAIIGNKGPFVASIDAAFEPYLGSKPTAEPTAPSLPTEFTAGGRTYELVLFFKEGESCVSGNEMVKRAKVSNANLGEEDGQFILEHRGEIPRELQGKCYLIFTDWRDPSGPRQVAYLRWNGHRWYRGWSGSAPTGARMVGCCAAAREQ